MATIIRLFGGSFGSDEMFIRCDLSQASSPVEYCGDRGGDWDCTQYQCADARHSTSRLAEEIGYPLAAQALEMSVDDLECEWEVVNGLAADADTDHEDARGWYSNYGWHTSTEVGHDVELQAVEYDWLDGDSESAVAKLMKSDSELTEEEASTIVDVARSVREAAESVESKLVAAVEAYEAGDYAACVAALDACEAIERDHGDSPATQALRSQLLDETLTEIMA